MNYQEFFDDNSIKVARSGYASAFDQYDQAFATLTSGGPKTPGEEVPMLFRTPELAWAAFENSLLVWLNGRRNVHIRMQPTLRTMELFRFDGHADEPVGSYWYCVRCRLTAY